MDKALAFFKASDGTPAVDAQVNLVTEPFRCGPKDRPSVQFAWGAGPVGAFGLQFSNDHIGSFGGTWTDYPAEALGVQPTQPTGAADNNIITVDSIGEWCRGKFTRTSGGTSVLPTARAAYTEDENS